MSKVTILHLSDLHLKSEEQAKALSSNLLEDINFMQERPFLEGLSGAPGIGKIDIVAVTGDLTNKCDDHEKEFSYVNDFFNRLSNELKLEKTRLVFVPGNHDVDWKQKENNLTSKFLFYNKFLQDFYGIDYGKLPFHFNTKDTNKRTFSLHPITVNDQKLLFICLNSAVMVYKDNEKKKIADGYLANDDLMKIEKAIEQDFSAYSERIALVHHSCLREENDRDSIKNWKDVKTVLEELGVKIIMHGHIHRGDIAHWVNINKGGNFLITSTGTARIWDGEKRKTDSYQYQILTLSDESDKKIHLYRRRFDQHDPDLSKLEGKWVADSDEHGRWSYKINPGTPYSIEEPLFDIKHKKFLFGTQNSENKVMISYHCSTAEPVEEPTFARLINLLSRYDMTFSTHQAPGTNPGEGFKYRDDERIDDFMKVMNKYLDCPSVFCIDSGGYNCYTQIFLEQKLKQNTMNLGVGFTWLSDMEEQNEKLDRSKEFQGIILDNIRRWILTEKDNNKDLGIIVRCPNPKTKGGIIFIAAGIHKAATMAAIEIICNANRLRSFLPDTPKTSDDSFFEAVFEVRHKNKKPDMSSVRLLHFRELQEGAISNTHLEMEWNTYLSLQKLKSTNQKEEWKRREELQQIVKEIKLQNVHLDLTCDCPYKCPACIEKGLWVCRSYKGSGKSSFTFEEILMILFELKDGGVSDLRLYGGEPMAHPDFDKVMIAAAGMGFHIRLVSNGYYLTDPNKLNAIKNISNYITCRFSINAATPEHYQKLHPLDPEQKLRYVELWEIKGRIQELSESGVDCEISFLLGTDNYMDLEDTFKMARDVRARAFHVRPKTRRTDTDITMLDSFDVAMIESIKNQKNNILEQLDKDMKSGTSYPMKIICPSWFNDYIERNGSGEILRKIKIKQYEKCYSSLYRIVISPFGGGRIVTCAYRRTDGSGDFYIPLSIERGWLKRYLDSSERAEKFMATQPSARCADIICNRCQDNLDIFSAIS